MHQTQRYGWISFYICMYLCSHDSDQDLEHSITSKNSFVLLSGSHPPPHPEVITVLSSSPKIDFVCSQDFTEPEPYDTTCSVCSFVSGFSLSMCPKDSP